METETLVFEQSYTTTYENLKERYVENDLSEGSAVRELESLYIYEDLDWTGRGELKNSEIQGAIAAYQVFLNDLAKGKLQRAFPDSVE